MGASRKIQKIIETVIYQEKISSGEAVAVHGRTVGHTMRSMGKSLEEARRKVGRPKITWRRTEERESRQERWTSWTEVRAQRKTGLVGERKLQPYAPHSVERTNYQTF